METKEGKYLTFYLKNEEYGVPIIKVKEIIGMMVISQIPQSPKFVKGVINLRGKIITLIDLRLKFGIEGIEYTERTCIIVIDIHSKDNIRQIGVVVDAVSEVVNINKGAIEPPPKFDNNDGESDEFLSGIAKVNDKIIMLLNTDKALNFKGLERIDSLGKANE